MAERKFAGSEFATTLLPQTKTAIQGKDAKIKVYVHHQPNLYRGSNANRVAYMFPTTSLESYLSVMRKPDIAYSIKRELLDPTTKSALRAANNVNHFPCLTTTFNGLLPFATGEVKVSGSPYKQRFQQGFYASYYIMASLVLRVLEQDAADKWESTEELLASVRHCCFSISPHSLQIWEYKPYFDSISGSVRISAQMLCNGAPSDQYYMENVYIPWSQFVLKRGVVEQYLRVLPAIKSYAARPKPRPFDYPDTLFLKISDLKPGAYDLGSSSFGNGPSQEQNSLHNVVKAYEDAVEAATKRGSLKRKSSQSASTSTSIRESFADAADSLSLH